MTLESFRTRVIAHAIVLASEGLPHDLATVCWWDDEWNAKWIGALNGRYDA